MDMSNILPIPNLKECRNLLCIQPHPDDNEVGAGATIAKLIKKGCLVTYLTVTDGGIGTLDKDNKDIVAIREKEILDSAKILGVHRTISLGYKDASYPDEKELCSKIVSVIRQVKPEMIMTVDPFLPYEAHPDHRKVGMAAAEASLFSGFPHFYSYGEANPSETWSVKGVAFYNTAYPNIFIDVDETWDLKLLSISAHKSQFSGEILDMYKQYFDIKSREVAGNRGYTHGEAFKVLTPMHLHANVDAINC